MKIHSLHEQMLSFIFTHGLFHVLDGASDVIKKGGKLDPPQSICGCTKYFRCIVGCEGGIIILFLEKYLLSVSEKTLTVQGVYPILHQACIRKNTETAM